MDIYIYKKKNGEVALPYSGFQVYLVIESITVVVPSGCIQFELIAK